MTNRRQLSRADVRQLAIRAQHLDRGQPPPLLDLIQEMGCVQLDPISAVERSHMLVLWSRGAARQGAKLDRALDKLRWTEKSLFEYWAHAASIVTTHDYPVHAWHMAQTRNNNARWEA
ncbi:MAG: crosslink repair DNA glycosylase YcaQ family protein, partial [Chloroflexota bacterium]